MKFILIADEEKIPKNFFPLWEIMAFFIIVSIVLIILYPENILNETLENQQPAAVTLSYLKSFSAKYPDDVTILFMLTEQEIQMGQIKEANKNYAHLKSIIQPSSVNMQKLAWLDYLMIRYKSYKAKLNTPQRIAYLAQMREMTKTLIHAPLNKYQFKTLAWDNLSLGDASVALKIYNYLVAAKLIVTAEDLSEAGSVAMQNNAHRDAARFYWAAYHKTDDIAEKRKYAVDALRAYWGGNFVADALALANQLPPEIINDRDMLLLLSRLALAANRPDIAQQYAMQALLMNPKNKHE